MGFRAFVARLLGAKINESRYEGPCSSCGAKIVGRVKRFSDGSYDCRPTYCPACGGRIRAYDFGRGRFDVDTVHLRMRDNSMVDVVVTVDGDTAYAERVQKYQADEARWRRELHRASPSIYVPLGDVVTFDGGDR